MNRSLTSFAEIGHLSEPLVHVWRISEIDDEDFNTRSAIFNINGENFSLGFWPKGGMVPHAAPEKEGMEWSQISLRCEFPMSKNHPRHGKVTTFGGRLVSCRYEGAEEAIRVRAKLRIVHPKGGPPQEGEVEALLGFRQRGSVQR